MNDRAGIGGERASGASPDGAVSAEFAVARIAGALESRTADESPPIVLVDGRSGSGKTTLGALVGARVPGARVIRLDELYPGWDGLEAASIAIHDGVLEPVSHGRAGAYRRWDWVTDAPGERVVVEPGHPLLIDGCGAVSVANASLAVLRVWVELDAAERRSRALRRDGDLFAPHWDRWARQEERFARRENPRALADLVVDGRTISG